MKQLPVFFTFLLLCMHLSSGAQVDIEYDFSTKKFTALPHWIKEGSAVQLLYKGVNKYALKSGASITSGNRSYDDGLSQLQAGLQQWAGEKKKAEDKKAETDASLNAPAPALNAQQQRELGAMSDYLLHKAMILAEIENQFGHVRQGIMMVNSIMSMDKDITAATDAPDLNTPALMDQAIFIQSGSTGIYTASDFTPMLAASIANITGALSNVRILINDLKDNLANSSLSDQQRKEEGVKLDKLVSDIEKSVSSTEANYSGQNLKTLQDNAADMSRRTLRLLGQDFTVGPAVIGNADGDYIEISDKVNDNAGKQVLEIKPFKINTYGGSRMDFSIGLSVNIGGQGKYKYDLRKNPTNATSGTAVDSVILLSDNKDRLFRFSPTIFVHWYRTTKCKLQWMLTTGLTPDFTEVSNSRLSIGTGLGFPATNNLARRLVLSAGISFGYADVLKTKYKDLPDYRSFGALAATDLTEKALKVGAFFSVSYNLGGTGH